MHERERIIVGIDGSPGADRALRWAARTAVLRDASLQVAAVYSETANPALVTAYGVVERGKLPDQRRVAEQIVHAAARQVAEWSPRLDVSAIAVPGRPAVELAERGRSAAMLVVGSRELKAIGSAVLGSVSCAVVTKSDVPVVVVRGDDPGRGSADPSGVWHPEGAIVAGIDGGPHVDAVLRFAFEHASRTGGALRLVKCAHLPEYVPEYWGPPPDPRTKVEIQLAETLAGWRQEYPGVSVSSWVLAAYATEGLLEESEGQALLIVGARTHHPVLGSLLGSVSQGVLHHARCPVAVVPAGPHLD